MSWQPPERPAWLERLNAHGTAVGAPESLVSLEPDELVETAARTTGLDDFGGSDWRGHYDVLLDALARESKLHLAGRLVVRTELLRTLRNRLRLADLWKCRPEILAAPVVAPVFIVGSPRSGTSILHELLACDPGNRSPAMWEMQHPVEALEGEEMRTVADDVVTFWHELQPEYEAMHANSGDLPNECIFMTMHEFLSDHWGGCHVVPSYDAHLAKADQRPAYRYHRRFLQTLQQRERGDRWLLKAPSHLFQLRTLFDIYPDARIIQTHRDPLMTIPSALSLMATLKWMRCEDVDFEGVGSRTASGYAYIYRKQIEWRASGELPDDRFVDVLYADILRDPIAAISRVYDALGWAFDSHIEQTMTSYIESKPRGSRGAHSYSLSEMDLEPVEERERFRFYQDRFDVPDEESARPSSR